jgi:hypothetical protein
MLERVGFVNVALHGDHVQQAPTTRGKVLVFLARKP